MAPSDKQIRAALEMLPQHILRKIIDERNISFKSRYTEELIERLLEDDWTDEEHKALKERVARVERERTPKSRYIAKIEAIHPGLGDSEGTERVRQVLEEAPAVFDESGLEEEGYEITQQSDNTLEGIHWTKSINYTLSPHGEIQTESKLYDTGFRFDLENQVLFINSTLPPKANSLLTELDHRGIETSEVGHGHLRNERANSLVQEFIDDIDEELQERRAQTTLDDDFGSEVIEVDMVKMLVDDIDLEDVRIGGRTDILKHPQVKEVRENYDSRIVRFEGNFELDNVWYDLKAGETDGMGQVSVRKQGSVEERPELVDKAFDFLYNYYEKYFIEVA